MYETPLFLPAGDQAMVVELGNAIRPEINRKVRNLMLAIERAGIAGVFDLVPTYRSILVYYNPLVVSYRELQARLTQLERSADEQALEKPRIVRIPTLYGGEYGPDLEFVAQHTKLTPQEVVKTHAGTDYPVYMMGFSPGFPYLGGMSERLTTPRLPTPRTEIPAGSVGIAERQTGVYPVATPGGWRLIGRTPLKLFDPNREPPSLLSAGDYVRFVPLASEGEYLDIKHRVESGQYQAVVEAAT